jgi:hypothetical protein
MSTITTNFRAPALARPTAHRAADGVVAGYIRSLVQDGPGATDVKDESKLSSLAPLSDECRARRSRSATRRRPPLRRAALTA